MLANYAHSKIINARPPKISEEEQELTREARRVLAQLRSGWSRRLNKDACTENTTPLRINALNVE